jgi:LysM repeat protein
LAQQYKSCPICGTRAHSAALICPVCGTSLKDVEVSNGDTRPVRPTRASYDRRYGETDLFEGDLRRPRQAYLWVLLFGLVAAAFAAGIIIGGMRLFSLNTQPAEAETPFVSTSPVLEILATNTPRPTILMETVTPPPPTSTPLPTEGPCMVQVQPGDDLISLAWRCGHRDLFILTQVLEINGLSAPERIQVGQNLEIPRPTVVGAPNSALPQVDTASSSEIQPAVALVALDQPTVRPSPTIRPTATLLPGVGWHVVQPNQSMYEIVFAYGTEAEVLQQLNPELSFLQCDFQFVTGGERCTVNLIAGQQIRVPIPLPTATLSPTPSGSETPTPSPTPTFNAPNPISPPDRAFFTRNDLVTLRWVASGSLAQGEVYRVRVMDLNTGMVYVGDTTELSFILPLDWQPTDGNRHDFEWTVSVISLEQPDSPLFTTQPRLFSWQGRS